jgi:peptide/nickel transport system permease protein
MSDAKQTSSGAPKAISGIDVMRGVGAQQAKGFWADAWERVLQRKGAVFGIAWISVVAFFAIFAPVLASAHPVYLERLDAAGAVTAVEWPLVANLTPTDWLLMIGFAVGVPWTFFGPKSLGRSGRLGVLVVALLQAGLTIVLAGSIAKWADSSSVEWLKQAARLPSGPWPIVGAVAAVVGLLALIVPTFDARGPRIATVAGTALLAATLLLMSGGQKLINFERYIDDERAGKIRAVWTPVPWSPPLSFCRMTARSRA